MRYELGYPRGNGVAIDVAVSGGPAEAAGVLPNDIIQSYNDQPLRSLTQFITMIQRTKVGEKVKLKVWRAEKEFTFTAQVVDYDDWSRAAEGREKDVPLADDKVILQKVGLGVRALTVLERMQGAEGVFVAEVVEQSEGEKIGIKGGDLILKINGRRVTEANDLLARLAASAAVQDSRIELRRGAQTLDLVLPQVLKR